MSEQDLTPEQLEQLREQLASVAAGELLLHEDSFGWLALAVNQGRAADRLGAGPGDPVEIASNRGGG